MSEKPEGSAPAPSAPEPSPASSEPIAEPINIVFNPALLDYETKSDDGPHETR